VAGDEPSTDAVSKKRVGDSTLQAPTVQTADGEVIINPRSSSDLKAGQQNVTSPPGESYLSPRFSAAMGAQRRGLKNAMKTVLNQSNTGKIPEESISNQTSASKLAAHQSRRLDARKIAS